MADKSKGLGANQNQNKGRNRNESGNIEKTERGQQQGQNQKISHPQHESQPGLGRSRGMDQNNSENMGDSRIL